MQLEFADDAQGGQIVGQRVAPAGQTTPFVDQFQRADPGMVEVIEPQSAMQRPLLPFAFSGGAGKHALAGDDDQTVGEVQAGIEVDFDPGLRFFRGGQQGFYFGGPVAGKRRLGADAVLYAGGH